MIFDKANMRFDKKLFIVSICFLFCHLESLNSFAYVSGKVNIEKKQIYCPEQIQCHRSPGGTQCDLNPEVKNYFNISMDTPNEGCIDTATFTGAHGAFHSNTPGISCDYRPAHPGSCRYISLISKPEANLEAYYDKNSLWVFSAINSTCLISKPSNCPITESFGFIIHNINVTRGLYVSINGINIIKPPINAVTYVNITFDDVFSICSSEKNCTIDITNSIHGKYGYIVIDMDSMKILQATSFYHEKIQINKSDSSYNSVDVFYPSYSSQPKNHLQSESKLH